jgi:hypothetical protein
MNQQALPQQQNEIDPLVAGGIVLGGTPVITCAIWWCHLGGNGGGPGPRSASP